MTEKRKWERGDVWEANSPSDAPGGCLIWREEDGRKVDVFRVHYNRSLCEGPGRLVARRKFEASLDRILALLNDGEAYPALVEAARAYLDSVDDVEASDQQHDKRDTLRDLLTKSAPPAKGGIAAVVGKWPGDETDEEFDAMIDEESKR